MYSTCRYLCQSAPFKRDPRPYFCLPLSHPNRVPLPGHEGGGEWGSGVNQGSWIYGWQTSLPPRAPVSGMRLWPLGGMGSTLSFCAYIGVWGCSSMCVCRSVCDVHLIIIAGAISLPCGCPLSNSWSGVNQSSSCRRAVSRRGHVKTPANNTHSATVTPLFWHMNCVMLVEISLQNVPLTP